jgi:peptide/nickel transport system ATP-binding protein
MHALRGVALRALSVPLVQNANVSPIIRVTNVVKTFRGHHGRPFYALKGVSIEVRSGESVGLVCESGSGKTTLARCLLGLETPTVGAIEIAGLNAADFTKMSTEDRNATRRVIQMVF